MGRSRRPPGLWADMETARVLNQYLGTDIAPWEVRELPDIYVEAMFEGLAVRAELGEKGLLRV